MENRRPNRRCLDRGVVSRIPAQTRSCQAASAPGLNTQGWVWTYLTAVLATAVGYDEAREVVNQVQCGILDEKTCGGA